MNHNRIEGGHQVAVLKFQTEFMKSHYVHAHTQLHEDRIDVVLTRGAVIPAEERLAQSGEGRDLLQRLHAAMFHSGEALLRERLESVAGLNVSGLATELDPVSGTTTIRIHLAQPFQDVSIYQTTPM